MLLSNAPHLAVRWRARPKQTLLAHLPPWHPLSLCHCRSNASACKHIALYLWCIGVRLCHCEDRPRNRTITYCPKTFAFVKFRCIKKGVLVSHTMRAHKLQCCLRETQRRRSGWCPLSLCHCRSNANTCKHIALYLWCIGVRLCHLEDRPPNRTIAYCSPRHLLS